MTTSGAARRRKSEERRAWWATSALQLGSKSAGPSVDEPHHAALFSKIKPQTLFACPFGLVNPKQKEQHERSSLKPVTVIFKIVTSKASCGRSGNDLPAKRGQSKSCCDFPAQPSHNSQRSSSCGCRPRTVEVKFSVQQAKSNSQTPKQRSHHLPANSTLSAFACAFARDSCRPATRDAFYKLHVQLRARP